MPADRFGGGKTSGGVLEYRREIDGLRAVAVVPVILFHADFEAFSGGFVGVDVFFVISGYLITSIILAEKDQGSFSLLTFYERRARRILPALFFVVLACLPFAWTWLPPKHLKDFSQSLVAVSLFSSNFLFWIESGYFEVAAELKPLLHTWSLAVEEQYYVLFPLLLLMLGAFRKRWTLLTLIVVGVVSLALAQWGSQIEPVAAFFLLPARAWELMIGAAIAFLLLYGREWLDAIANQKAIPECLGLGGIGLVVYAVFAFDDTTPYPSLYALVPTLGTALIILFTTPQTTVGRLLGHRMLVGIGLISYSAYLWHQPLFAFARHRSLTQPSEMLYAVLSLLALGLAFLSWRYIEVPFRNKGTFVHRKIFGFAIGGTAALISVGMIGHFGTEFRDEKHVLLSQTESRLKRNYGLSESCNGEPMFSLECQTSDEPEIVVWGDSYAMHLVSGILASNPDAKIIQLTKSVCGPMFAAAPTNSKYPTAWAHECLRFTEKVHEWLRSNKSVRYAVLSSPFFQYLNGKNDLIVDGKRLKATPEIAVEVFRKTLEELIRMGIQPVIVSPPPKSGFNIGDCLVKATFLSLSLDNCDFPADIAAEQNKVVHEFLRQFSNDYRVVWLDEIICRKGRCLSHLDSTFIYRDTGHLSYEGSAALGRQIDFYSQITGEGGAQVRPRSHLIELN